MSSFANFAEVSKNVFSFHSKFDEIVENICHLEKIVEAFMKCHRLSFLMPQTWFVYSTGHFRAKITDF
jgi:hypothetical protein